MQGNLAINEVLQTARDLFDHVGASFVIDKGLNLRFQRLWTSDQLTNSVFAPHEAALLGKIDLCIRSVIKTVRAQMEMWGQSRHRRSAQCLFLIPARRLILRETETFQATHEFTFDGHFTFIVYFGQKGLLLFEPAQKHGCAPVHKSLGQTLVQRI